MLKCINTKKQVTGKFYKKKMNEPYIGKLSLIEVNTKVALSYKIQSGKNDCHHYGGFCFSLIEVLERSKFGT